MFIKVTEIGGKELTTYIRDSSIDAIVDHGNYRVVQVNHRHIHVRETYEEIEHLLRSKFDNTVPEAWVARSTANEF